MGDFDFGSLSDFSLGGSDTGGAAFPSGLSFSGAESSPAIPSGGFSLGVNAGFDASSLPTLGEGGGGFGDLVSGIGSGIKGALEPVAGAAKAISPLVGLGTAATGMAAGIQGAKTSAANAKINRQALDLQRQIAGKQQAAAQPLTEFGKNTLDRAQAGQVPPAIEAQIDLWKRGAVQKARDYAARSGQGDSMMLRQWEDYIDQQAQGMRAQYLMEQQQQGVGALAQGAGALGGAASTAGSVRAGAESEGNSIAQLMEQANKAIASLSAGAS